MITVIKDIKFLYELEQDWKLLTSQSDSPMTQFEWFLSCAETLSPGNKIRIYVLKENDIARAIAPLVINKGKICDWLEILGASILNEPAELMYDSSDSLVTLLRFIIDSGYPVNLQRIHMNEEIQSSIQAACKGKAISLSRASAGSCYINIRSDWEGFYNSIGKKWRADFRNKKNRAAKLGNVEFEALQPDLLDYEAILADCFIIESTSWKGRNGTALLDNEPLRNFFLHYAKQTSQNGTLRVFFLSVNRQRIAMHLGVQYKEQLWFYKMGYDERWSKISPGMQLAFDTIKYAFDNKLKNYEFLGSEEAWQHAWPVETHQYASAIIYPFSILGITGIADTLITYIKNRIF